jgi:hypothetical protein
MRLVVILSFIYFVPISNTFPQAPLIQWQKCFGGSQDDQSGSIVQLSDSNFIVSGITYSNDGDVTGNHGTSDLWVYKIDQAGNLIWQKCFGGSYIDGGISVRESIDRGVIICGEVKSIDGDVIGNHGIFPAWDVWVIKLDYSGNLQWQKCFGGSGDEFVFQFIQTVDSSFVFVGSTTSNDGDVNGNHSIDTSDYWVVKFDTLGNIIWQKCFGGSGSDVAYSIAQTDDHGYIIVGFTYSNDGDVSGSHDTTGIYEDGWVVKMDEMGNIQWQKCLGGSYHDILWSVVQGSNNNYVIIGHTNSLDGDVIGNHSAGYDVWFLVIDSAGIIKMQKCFGGSAYDLGFKILRRISGGFIIGGETTSNDGDVIGNHGSPNSYDYWIFEIDSLGSVQWQKCFGGTGNEYIRNVIDTYDGGLIVCGDSESNDGDVSGHHSPNSTSDSWVLKLSSPYLEVQTIKNSISDFAAFQNQVNKTIETSFFYSGNENVIIHLIDISGSILLHDDFNANIGLNKHRIFIGDLAGGIYFVRLQTEGGTVIKKVVIQ